VHDSCITLAHLSLCLRLIGAYGHGGVSHYIDGLKYHALCIWCSRSGVLNYVSPRNHVSYPQDNRVGFHKLDSESHRLVY